MSENRDRRPHHRDMNHSMSCEPPFWKNPSIIFHPFTLQYQPVCEHSMWNFIVRLLFLSFFIGLIGCGVAGLPAIPVALLFGLLTAFAVIFITPLPENSHHWDTYHTLPYMASVNVDAMDKVDEIDKINPSHLPVSKDGTGAIPITSAVQEHFVNGASVKGSVQPFENTPVGIAEVDAMPYTGTSLPDYTPPTSRNPFMNVLLDEYKYNPNRPEAAPIHNLKVNQTLDDFFRVQWFSDPTDVFGKSQDQRQYITQPSTTVPNDQGAFANWLYKIPGKTCKEGGREACLAGTDGGSVPWLNQAS